jgi:hypothetical protein
MPSELEIALHKLESTEKQLLDTGLAIGKAYGGAFYGLDFLAFAVLKRSLALIAGFSTLLRAKNFVCAAALVRLHLDSLLRFAAATLVDEPHKFATAVLNGHHVRKLRDKRGELMTDQYLVSCLSAQNPWIRRVYEATSGYIHLSRKHIFNALNPGDATGPGSMALSKEDEFIPDSARVEACAAMEAITDLILHYLDSWRAVKDNPPAKQRT